MLDEYMELGELLKSELDRQTAPVSEPKPFCLQSCSVCDSDLSTDWQAVARDLAGAIEATTAEASPECAKMAQELMTFYRYAVNHYTNLRNTRRPR